MPRISILLIAILHSCSVVFELGHYGVIARTPKANSGELPSELGAGYMNSYIFVKSSQVILPEVAIFSLFATILFTCSE